MAVKECPAGFRNPAVESRLLALGEEFTDFHPGMLAERDGVFVHHYLKDGEVGAAVVTGADLDRLRRLIAAFDEMCHAHLKCSAAAAGGRRALEALESRHDRLYRELDKRGPDLEIVEQEMKRQALNDAALDIKRLLERKESGLPAPVCPKCGGAMKRASDLRKKKFTTMVGAIEVSRRYYHCAKCGEGVCPFDVWFGLEGQSMTQGVERMLLRTGADCGSREAAELIRDLAGVEISRSRLQRRVAGLGEEAIRFEQEHVPEPPEAPSVLVALADGAGVPARPSEVAGRRGRQPDGGAKTREAKILRFHQLETDPENGPARAARGSITQTAAIDSAAVGGGGNHSDFSVRLSREAKRRGAFGAGKLVAISDGAEWIRNSFAAVFPDQKVTCVLDFFHAAEYLFDAVKELHADEAERKEEFARLRKLLLEGAASKVVDELEASAEASGKVAGCVRYFKSNLSRMRYDQYRKQGLPIGSGVIEGGCRKVIRDRLNKSGCRWSVKGANQILAIRCCHLNNRTTEFFEWKNAA